MENRELLMELKIELYNLCLLEDSTQGDVYFDDYPREKQVTINAIEIDDVNFSTYEPEATLKRRRISAAKIKREREIQKLKREVRKAEEERLVREEKERLEAEARARAEAEKLEREKQARLEAERIAREKEEEEELFFSLEREKKNTEKATKYVNVALQKMRNGKAQREYGYGRLYVNIENIKYVFYLSDNKDILYIQPNVCQRFFYTGINDENVKSYKKYFKGGK